MENRRLYRSRNHKVLMGLAGGIGEFFRIDPNIIRIILIVVEFATAGLLIILYFIVALIVPKEPLTPTASDSDDYAKSLLGRGLLVLAVVAVFGVSLLALAAIFLWRLLFGLAS